MVSDTPVMCSRVDGVVALVKTDRPNSRRPYPDWGEFFLVRSSLPRPNVSGLSFKENRRLLLENCREGKP